MLTIPPPEYVPAIAAALKGGVAGDGELTPVQCKAINGMAKGMFGVDIDVAQLEALTASQAAEAIPVEQLRIQVIQAIIGLDMLQPDPHRSAVDVEGGTNKVVPGSADRVTQYAQGLEVDVAQVKAFRAVAEDHRKRAILDLFYRSPAQQRMIDTVQDAGLVSTIRAVAASRGHGTSPAVADKWRRLEDCPDGSWGKQVSIMYQLNGWSYPGEPLGVPEPVTVHDWVHVLSGYSPTPVGELQVAAFMHASAVNTSSFSDMFFPLVGFGLGGFHIAGAKSVPQGDDYQRDDIGLLFAEAVKRSKATGVDLLAGVDHWGNADKSIEELRATYGIPEKSLDIGESDPGLPDYAPI